jgi:hypothetical protein
MCKYTFREAIIYFLSNSCSKTSIGTLSVNVGIDFIKRIGTAIDKKLKSK